MVPLFILSTFMVLVLFYLRCGDFYIYHACCKIVDFNFFCLGRDFCVSVLPTKQARASGLKHMVLYFSNPYCKYIRHIDSKTLNIGIIISSR